jgi:hypothetical protein
VVIPRDMLPRPYIGYISLVRRLRSREDFMLVLALAVRLPRFHPMLAPMLLLSPIISLNELVNLTTESYKFPLIPNLLPSVSLCPRITITVG